LAAPVGTGRRTASAGARLAWVRKGRLGQLIGELERWRKGLLRLVVGRNWGSPRGSAGRRRAAGSTAGTALRTAGEAGTPYRRAPRRGPGENGERQRGQGARTAGQRGQGEDVRRRALRG
jgi:hypothetical protein